MRRAAGLALPLVLAVACAAPSGQPAASGSAAASASATAAADAVASFYRGKTIRVIVPSEAGGLPDQSGRRLARFLPKYLPGAPNVIVENRPGASGFVAANAAYNTEPKDGTVIVVYFGTAVLQQALGAPGLQADFGKVNWLGGANRSLDGCLVRTDTGITRIQDVMGPNGKQVVIGSNAPGSIIEDGPKVMNSALGTRFKIVSGYASITAITKAVQAKEVDGLCGGIDPIARQLGDMLKGPTPQAKFILVFESNPRKDPLLEGVPSAETLATSDDGKQIIRAINAPGAVTNAFWVAPEVPKDRLEALRAAALKAFADPEFVDQAHKEGLPDVYQIPGDEIAGLVKQLLATPKATLDKLRAVIGG